VVGRGCPLPSGLKRVSFIQIFGGFDEKATLFGVCGSDSFWFSVWSNT